MEQEFYSKKKTIKLKALLSLRLSRAFKLVFN